MNRQGKPLVSGEVIVSLIASTRSKTGLRVRSELCPGSYPLALQSPTEMTRVEFKRHPFKVNWEYTICPKEV